jgi:diguanylate cyclase (GGDEF)-like protein
MFIDLDDFKSINDTHGHDVGDTVLRGVADRLQASVRGGDTVGRRGGDEFLFLMPEVRDDVAVTDLAMKILDRVAAPLDIDGVALSVRPSIGFALFPDDGQSEPELLKCADLAMYGAKQKKLGVLRYRAAVPA